MTDIADRQGAIEIAVIRPEDAGEERHGHLVWRVRLFDVGEKTLLVEAPSTLGQSIRLRDEVMLFATFTIGQNRWMFSTCVLESTSHQVNERYTVEALRLQVPDRVERCQRRRFYRLDTVAIDLPSVRIWPLLDPKSVTVAERANELRFQAEVTGSSIFEQDDVTFSEDEILPEVGPEFSGTLVNLGGGGIGVQVPPEEAHLLDQSKIFWIRFMLPPDVRTPICATGKLVHAHRESTQSMYAGLVFDFTFNPGHQRFVADQVCKYVAAQQRAQLQRLRTP